MPNSNKVTYKKIVMYECVTTSSSYDVVPISEFRAARKGKIQELDQ